MSALLFGLVVGIGAQPAASDQSPPPEEPPVAGSPPWHQPFTPYEADPGALTFDELDEHEQAVIDAERNRDSAEDLAARFDTLKAMTIARGERTHAEVSASMVGLEGLGNEGVVP